MGTERRKVLDMLAEGKVAVGDAERLLSKLAASVNISWELELALPYWCRSRILKMHKVTELRPFQH